MEQSLYWWENRKEKNSAPDDRYRILRLRYQLPKRGNVPCGNYLCIQFNVPLLSPGKNHGNCPYKQAGLHTKRRKYFKGSLQYL